MLMPPVLGKEERPACRAHLQHPERVLFFVRYSPLDEQPCCGYGCVDPDRVQVEGERHDETNNVENK